MDEKSSSNASNYLDLIETVQQLDGVCKMIVISLQDRRWRIFAPVVKLEEEKEILI